jgi:phenylalanyl-tRNA synthetase beta chain
MLISMKWLSRHVDLEGITPLDLARELTLRTAEVEGLERFAAHLDDVVVGHVLTREGHPDADKLSVCTVDVGADEPLQIVCGAPNVDAGQNVAVAQVGTRLPGDFKIKKAKIRGVESRGMICSVRELELGEDHDGIWVLPEGLQKGAPVAQALDLVDWIIEIDNKSLTHRPDLWGHRGIAAEVAAIFGRELIKLDTSLPDTGDAPGLDVQIEDPACPRYLALSVDDVRVEASPQWLQFLLLAVGQRPLDILVDISNFVMLDLGQPNHLFDRGQVSDGIKVRMGREGETVTTLDDEVRKVGTADLLICSGDSPVALAGVMGGEGSKVAPETTSLLLEVASFDATTVRRTASRVGLRTDSSARFEKSLDPCMVPDAAAHLVRTLQAIQPDVKLPSAPVDVGEWRDPSKTVTLKGDFARSLLGVELSDEEMAETLTSLRFGVEVSDGVLEVAVPSYRATKDVGEPVDLVEEIGRMHGYFQIPGKRLIAEVSPPARDPRQLLAARIQDRLSGGARFSEALCYSFQSDELLERLGVADEPRVRVVNPVAEGEASVRRSVVPSLLGRVEINRRHRGEVRLFEVGKGYLPELTDDRGQPGELHEAGLVLAAPYAKDAAFNAGARTRLQGVVEDLLMALGVTGAAALRWRALGSEDEVPGWANPGRAQVLEAGEGEELSSLCFLAELDPGCARSLGLVEELTSDVAAAGISLDALLALPKAPASYRPLPKFPGAKVDVALALPVEVACGEAETELERSGKGLVASMELFDVYEGPNLPDGQRSLAWHIVLEATDRTLDEGDLQKFLGRVERAAERLGGALRRESAVG